MVYECVRKVVTAKNGSVGRKLNYAARLATGRPFGEWRDYKSGPNYPTLEYEAKLPTQYAQVRAYADAVEEVTGSPVADFGLWYIQPDAVVQWT